MRKRVDRSVGPKSIYLSIRGLLAHCWAPCSAGPAGRLNGKPAGPLDRVLYARPPVAPAAGDWEGSGIMLNAERLETLTKTVIYSGMRGRPQVSSDHMDA